MRSFAGAQDDRYVGDCLDLDPGAVLDGMGVRRSGRPRPYVILSEAKDLMASTTESCLNGDEILRCAQDD
jgi:hypothetical protein